MKIKPFMREGSFLGRAPFIIIFFVIYWFWSPAPVESRAFMILSVSAVWLIGEALNFALAKYESRRSMND